MSPDTLLTPPAQSAPTIPKVNYLTKEYGLRSWLLTGDHKRIAILYLISLSIFFCIGGTMAGLIRLQLLTPHADLMSSDTYNKVFTMHGVIMVFLFLVPSVPATLGNFLIPMMIGAKDLALPRINLLRLVSLCDWGNPCTLHHDFGRGRYRLDLYNAAVNTLREH